MELLDYFIILYLVFIIDIAFNLFNNISMFNYNNNNKSSNIISYFIHFLI